MNDVEKLKSALRDFAGWIEQDRWTRKCVYCDASSSGAIPMPIKHKDTCPMTKHADVLKTL